MRHFSQHLPLSVFSALLISIALGCGNDNADGGETTGPSRPGADAGDRTRPGVDVEPSEEDVQRPPLTDTTPSEPEDAHADGTGEPLPDTSPLPDSGPPPDEEPYIQRFVEPGAEALPDQFAAASEAPGGPMTVYPATETAMPRNVAAPVFQWEGPSNSPYLLRIEAPSVDIEVYVNDWRWQPSQAQWDGMVARLQGKDAQWYVTSLVGGEARAGEPADLYISRSSVDGAIYYWAPSQSAIVRLAADEDRPEPFVTGTIFSCAGCHALSPDGSRLAYTRGSGTPIGNMGVVATDASRRQIQPETLNGYFPSFAPDNVHMAVARGGNIVVINTDTGADAGTLPRLDGTSSTMPAWSPNNDAMVFAAGSSGAGGFGGLDALSTSNSGLAHARRVGDAWADPTWLIPRGGLVNPNETIFYPAYAPDGQWIVMNRADASAGAGSSPAGSELWLINAHPESSPEGVLLQRANGDRGYTNSWPKWAPSIGDGRMWIAFTSTRPYGRISSEHSQIWIASIKPEDLAAGLDPSAAAYWMPHQELNTSNHVAYWSFYSKEDER